MYMNTRLHARNASGHAHAHTRRDVELGSGEDTVEKSY